MDGDHDTGAARARAVPADHATWWRTERQLWWRDFDSLGHLTASAYGVLFQDAFADFMVAAGGGLDQQYVVARMDITYLREVVPADSPVQVHVRIDRLGRSGFDATMVLSVRSMTGQTRVCSTCRCSFAAWDASARRSRALTSRERERLAATGGYPDRTSGSANR